jgi:hypothetical protein
MPSSEARNALLVVRAWREDRVPSRLAAQISRTVDVSLGFQHVETRTDIEQVCQVVRRWLEKLAVGAQPRPEDNGAGGGAARR